MSDADKPEKKFTYVGRTHTTGEELDAPGNVELLRLMLVTVDKGRVEMVVCVPDDVCEMLTDAIIDDMQKVIALSLNRRKSS